MMCDQGGAPDFFKPTSNAKVKIHGCLVATKVDFVQLTNIPSFKICKLTEEPCVPDTTTPWKDTWSVKVNGKETLIGKSKCKCNAGGTVEFMTSGQIPLPEDAQAEVEDLQNQAQRTLDDAGYGDSVGEAGFWEGMIPVWGSGRDMINDIQTGDVGGAIMNGAFLVWDVASIVAGVFSFGAGTAAMQGAKVGVKTAIKTGMKKISQTALKGLGKAGFKKLSKEALKKSIDDVAKKLFKTCVFACFPAGTPVHTEFGIKNIEDIRIGDRVWAYDEDTDTLGLQLVVNTTENESDHTISLYTETEVIETTAIHPFYTEEGWKDASELSEGDKILTKKQEKVEIKKIEYSYEPKKVYNFEVANWHTYFVGIWAWLVHNKGRCLSELINWNWKSSKTFGHSFLTHGEKNFKSLVDRARGTGKPQGLWKNNEDAANLIKNNYDTLQVGKNTVDIPRGLGQVIKPDGTAVDATQATIVKNPPGAQNLINTAYPIF